MLIAIVNAFCIVRVHVESTLDSQLMTCKLLAM